MNTSQRTAYTIFASAILMVIGSFLAWASLSFLGVTESVSGWEGDDGKITVVIGVALGVLGWLAYSGTWKNWIVTLVAALAGFLVGVLNFVDINDVGADVGIGLYVVIIAGIVGTVGAWFQRQEAIV